MAEDCAQRHFCEPPRFPDELGEKWTCWDCGAEHYAFDVHETYAGQPRHEVMLRHVPLGTLGWTTTTPDPTRRTK